MSRLAIAVWLVSTASPAIAQSPATTPSPSLVFVYDGGGAHVSGDRIRRAIATGLHRPVLRLTDEAAATAAGRLTVAFSPPNRWVVDLVRGQTHTTRGVVLRASTVSSLARIAIALVTESEPPPAPARATPSARRVEWIALIGDEILDPFVGQPPYTRRRALTTSSELVDPFGGGVLSRRGYDDVIDPWSR